jgi:hypothetical protein
MNEDEIRAEHIDPALEASDKVAHQAASGELS